MSRTFYITGTAKSPLPIWLQFEELVESLINRGFRFRKSLPADLFIAMNHSRKTYSTYIKNGGSASRAILVLLEPEAVYPSQYKKAILKKYSLVLRPGNPTHKNALEKFIAWPYEYNANPLTPNKGAKSLKEQIDQNVESGLFSLANWKVRKQYLAIINSNKVSPALIENYSLRRSFAKGINPEFLSVYGDLWAASILDKIKYRLRVFLFSILSGSIPNLKNIYGNFHWKFPASRGVIANKQIVLQDVKFNIVIENDPTYISEKVFDSMINGCIPIYSGPAMTEEIIPSGTYILLPSDPDKLLSSLNLLSDGDLQSILSNMKKFISSPGFISRWEKSAVFATIGHAIADFYGETIE